MSVNDIIFDPCDTRRRPEASLMNTGVSSLCVFVYLYKHVTGHEVHFQFFFRILKLLLLLDFTYLIFFVSFFNLPFSLLRLLLAFFPLLFSM
jgi:hypothetical protein